MNILIISSSYPPLNKVSTYRIFAFAYYWSSYGHKVSVLTTKKYRFDPDLSYVKTHSKIAVYEVPYAKWLTNRFEIKNRNVNSDKTDKQHKPAAKGIIRFLRKVVKYDLRNLWTHAGFKYGKEIIENNDIDIIFSSYGPKSSHIIASRIKKKYPNLFWVADFRDLWSGSHLSNLNLIQKRYRKHAENSTTKRANLLLTVSEPLKEYLKTQYNIPVYVVENGYFIEDIELAKGIPVETREDNFIKIIYTGLIYPGKRDPSPLFKAIKELMEENKVDISRLKILFYGNEGNVNELAELYNVKSCVELAGKIPKQEAIIAQRNADALLFLEWESTDSEDYSSKGVLTGKLFDYLTSGTEIMGVGITEKSISGKLILESNTGMVYGTDYLKIKEKLSDLLQNGKVKITPDLEIIGRYDRKVLAKKAIDIITQEYTNTNAVL